MSEARAAAPCSCTTWNRSSTKPALRSAGPSQLDARRRADRRLDRDDALYDAEGEALPLCYLEPGGLHLVQWSAPEVLTGHRHGHHLGQPLHPSHEPVAASAC